MSAYSANASPNKKQRTTVVLSCGEIIAKSLIRVSEKGGKRYYLYCKFPKLDARPLIILVFGHETEYAALQPGDMFSLSVDPSFESEKEVHDELVTFKLGQFQTITKLGQAATSPATMEVPMTDVRTLKEYVPNMAMVNIKVQLVEVLKADTVEINRKMFDRQSYRFADDDGSVLIHFLGVDMGVLKSAKKDDVYEFYLLRCYKFGNQAFLSYTYESSAMLLAAAEKFKAVKDELISSASNATKPFEKATIASFKAYDYWFKCGGCPDGRMLVSETNRRVIKCPRCKLSTAITNSKCGIIAKVEMQLQLANNEAKWITCFNKGIHSLLSDKAVDGNESAAELIIRIGDGMETELDNLIGAVATFNVIEGKNILDSVKKD